MSGELAGGAARLEPHHGRESRGAGHPGKQIFWWVRCIKYFRGQIYWPCLLTGRGPGVAPQLATFKLQLWDAGDGAVRKYGHVYPVCREDASGVILTFSFTDRSSWEELPALIQRTIAGAGDGVESILPIVVGTKFGSVAENEVSQEEVAEAETNWNIPIIKVRHSTGPAPTSLPEVATALNTICEQLWLAKHRGRLSAEF